MIAEKLMSTTDELTTDDIKKSNDSREKVNNQIWSDDGIIEGLMAKKRMMIIMIGIVEEKTVFPQTHNTAISSLTASVTLVKKTEYL